MSAEQNIRLAVACAFADALDHRAYETARELLADDCVYQHRDRRIEGPTDIIRSYQQADELSSFFDLVELASLVDKQGDTARVTFVDRIALGDKDHVYRCQQRLLFNEKGYIVRIIHEELPGQRERLTQFFDEVGVRHQPRSTSKPSASQ